MIRSSELLERFERDYARERLKRTTYADALAIFTALWVEARALNPDFPDPDWRQDLAPDLQLARVLNGLPPNR